jgi:hypothetical protein
MMKVIPASEIWILSAAGFVAFFVLIWCFVLWVLAFAGGWRRLAQQYGDTTMFTGDTSRFKSARIGTVNYNGALVLGATDMGLYLAPIAIFRPFHRPMFIPWGEIQGEPFQGAFGGVVLTFPSISGARIHLYARTVEPIRRYLTSADQGSAW